MYEFTEPQKKKKFNLPMQVADRVQPMRSLYPSMRSKAHSNIHHWHMKLSFFRMMQNWILWTSQIM